MTTIKDRLAVVETAYHQQFGKQPHSIETRFSRQLSTQNQLYERQLVATEEWYPLDCGWLESTGMMVLVNNEGKFLQVQPTDEEREAAERKVLEVSYQDAPHNVWLILPRESMRAQPGDVRKLRIRCQSGVARFTLCLFPS